MQEHRLAESTAQAREGAAFLRRREPRPARERGHRAGGRRAWCCWWRWPPTARDDPGLVRLPECEPRAQPHRARRRLVRGPAVLSLRPPGVPVPGDDRGCRLESAAAAHPHRARRRAPIPRCASPDSCCCWWPAAAWRRCTGRRRGLPQTAGGVRRRCGGHGPASGLEFPRRDVADAGRLDGGRVARAAGCPGSPSWIASAAWSWGAVALAARRGSPRAARRPRAASGARRARRRGDRAEEGRDPQARRASRRRRRPSTRASGWRRSGRCRCSSRPSPASCRR